MLEARRRTSVLAPEASATPAGTFERRTVEVPGCGSVAHLRHGSGPPLLLVHGIPTSCRLWEPLLGDLGAHFDCIVPDLLGLGRSLPAPGARLDSPGQADMLAGLLDALGVDEALVVAHDQGGAHVGQLLARHGGRVRGVAFVDVVCLDNWPVPLISALMAVARVPPLLDALAAARVLQAGLGVAGFPRTVRRLRTVPEAMREDWLWVLGPDAPPEARAAFRGYVTAQDVRWTAEAVPALNAWDKPAHVVWGADDHHLPVRWAARLAAELPTAGPPVVIPDASHFLQAEVPRTLAAELLRFLRAV
jgi:pimeloyl-ACP methyl ester carboxylesterase